jgi:small subunit ribosomal protein S9
VTESETPTTETSTPVDSATETSPPVAEAADVPPAPIEASEAPATDEAPELPKPPASGIFWGTGRRKSAVARVRITPGEGKILINKRGVDEYFHEPQERLAVHEPLIATNTESSFDVRVNVRGGGHSGQAGAIRLGVARALLKANERYEPPLRDKGYLTRDARVVERKKYGQRKARRRFQFSKR